SGLEVPELWAASLDARALTVLGEGAFRESLTTLRLACNFFDDAGAAALAGWQGFDRLADLDLGGNSIGVGGSAALADAAFLPGVRRLDLGSLRFGGPALARLLGPGRLTSLSFLDLDCADALGDGGVEAIAGAACLANLARLKLTNAKLTDADVMPLL